MRLQHVENIGRDAQVTVVKVLDDKFGSQQKLFVAMEQEPFHCQITLYHNPSILIYVTNVSI